MIRALVLVSLSAALVSCRSMDRGGEVAPTSDPAATTTRPVEARPVTIADLDAVWTRCRAALDALYDARLPAPVALIEATRDIDDMRLRLRGGAVPADPVKTVLANAETALANLPK